MLTFEKWLDEWKIDSDYEPTEKEVDAMRDAWDGAIQTMREAAEQSVYQTCSTCGGENGKHELDCRVAHNMLADNASW